MLADPWGSWDCLPCRPQSAAIAGTAARGSAYVLSTCLNCSEFFHESKVPLDRLCLRETKIDAGLPRLTTLREGRALPLGVKARIIAVFTRTPEWHSFNPTRLPNRLLTKTQAFFSRLVISELALAKTKHDSSKKASCPGCGHCCPKPCLRLLNLELEVGGGFELESVRVLATLL